MSNLYDKAAWRADILALLAEVTQQDIGSASYAICGADYIGATKVMRCPDDPEYDGGMPNIVVYPRRYVLTPGDLPTHRCTTFGSAVPKWDSRAHMLCLELHVVYGTKVEGRKTCYIYSSEWLHRVSYQQVWDIALNNWKFTGMLCPAAELRAGPVCVDPPEGWGIVYLNTNCNDIYA